MIVSSALPDFTMISVKVFCLGSRSDFASSSAMPSTPFIGVRISWLILARNSDFARSASTALCRASCSSRSCDFSSDTSMLEPIRWTVPSLAISRLFLAISCRRVPSRWVSVSSVSIVSPVRDDFLVATGEALALLAEEIAVGATDRIVLADAGHVATRPC